MFYDEFVEKQLLAGNIPSRHFNITLVSVLLTIPAADHTQLELSQQGLGRQNSEVTLQSILEQEVEIF